MYWKSWFAIVIKKSSYCIRWSNLPFILKVSHQLGSLMDLYTTFATMAGAKVPTDRVVDGIDLTETLFSNAKVDR